MVADKAVGTTLHGLLSTYLTNDDEEQDLKVDKDLTDSI